MIKKKILQVKGVVIDAEGEVKWIINGTWDNKVEIAPLNKVDGSWQPGPFTLVWQRVLPP